jgi:diguanylate cyclase
VLQSGRGNVNLEQHTDLRGARRIIETKKTVLQIQGERFLLGVIRDLTVLTQIQAELAKSNLELDQRVREQTAELSRANTQLHHLAFFDPLTGLPNRRLLTSSLERRLVAEDRFSGESFAKANRTEALAIFYIDLDNFKRANDSHGHAFGDAMLVQMAQRLRASSHFSLIARVGGDEFIGISREGMALDKMSLAQICRDILEDVSKPFWVENLEASASASIGVSIAQQDGTTVAELMQCADNAMFRAKERGRNQYAFFTANMNAKSRENVAIERGLRRAIRAGDIDVYFQPIVDAKSSTVLGVEALARWNDAELGAVSPELFVPIAESSGLVHELSHFVLRRALKLAKAHLAPNQRLSVNLSALQLDRLTLIEDVRRALVEHDFEPERLELEITESLAANKDSRLLTVLTALSDLGISLALDDFGTGYSALAQMQRLPIDRVKIDKSFVQEIATNPKSQAIVKAMVQLAHGLELSVVAEGVETSAQRQVLIELGCNELQGFLLGRPKLYK